MIYHVRYDLAHESTLQEEENKSSDKTGRHERKGRVREKL